MQAENPPAQWHHDDFYDDAIVRNWYKSYIATLVNRTNSLVGVKYVDDPTIFAWQLANEPRCVGTGGAPESTKCVTRGTDGVPHSILTDWVAEMSSYIKSIDANHMVSVSAVHDCNHTDTQVRLSVTTRNQHITETPRRMSRLATKGFTALPFPWEARSTCMIAAQVVTMMGTSVYQQVRATLP